MMKQHWDNKSPDYEEFYKLRTKTAKLKIHRKARMIVNAAELPRYGYLLEIGCGTGLFTREYTKLKHNIYVHATDISPRQIELAIEGRGCRIFYHVLDAYQIQNLGWLVGTFDAVVGSYVLEYLELDRVLPEISKVLKQNGRIAFVELNALNPVAFAMTRIPFIRRLKGEPEFAQSFYWWQLEKKLRQHGFTDFKWQVIEFVGNRWLNSIIERIPMVKYFGGTLFFSAKKEG